MIGESGFFSVGWVGWGGQLRVEKKGEWGEREGQRDWEGEIITHHALSLSLLYSTSYICPLPGAWLITDSLSRLLRRINVS